MRSNVRSSTLLLVAMVGLSMVFGSGCTPRKKSKKSASEVPDEKSSTEEGKSPTGDQASATPTGGDSATGSSFGKSDLSTAKPLASNEVPNDSLGANPVGSTAGTEFGPATGTSPVSDGLDARHGAATIGEDTLAASSADAVPVAGDDGAPIKHKKKKKGKKKKKHAVVDDSDGETAAADDIDSAPSKGSYTVKKGDTLSRIAKRNHMSLQKLLKMNKLTLEDAPHLKVGQRLKISANGNAG